MPILRPFSTDESALAEHYQVSRTVAHEVLMRLERTGLVVQDRNQRWYAGPLTIDLLREHYEMRWLLEPIALGQALGALDPKEIALKEKRARRVSDGSLPARDRETLSATYMSISCSAAITASSARRSGGASCP